MENPIVHDKKNRILLVDDHQIVVEGLQLLLEGADRIHCVGKSHSGREALNFLETNEVDIVLLDIDMPEMDGIQCCKIIRKRYPEIHVIALTMINERSLVRKMLEAGAMGFLLKNAGRDEVLSAIYRVSEGKSYYSSEIMDILIKRPVSKRGERLLFPTLSSREKQILSLILEELTTVEIAGQLHISFNTVETHRRNIMHKLGAKNTAGLVKITLENHLLDGEG